MPYRWLLKDSRGTKSWHITLAVPALIAASVWFLAGGISLEFPWGLKVITATKSGSDYLLFAGPWLSALGFRDYLKRNGHNGNSDITGPETPSVPSSSGGGFMGLHPDKI